MHCAKYLSVFPALFFAILALEGCTYFASVLTQPRVSVLSLTPIQTTRDAVRVIARLSVENPNPISLRLRSIEYRLDIKRHFVFSGIQTSVPLVKDREIKIIEIPFTLNPEALAAAFPSLPGHSGPFYFHGQILSQSDWTGSRLIFASGEEAQFTLPALPLIKIESWKLINSERQFAFSLAISNPNSFAIQLRNLQGTAELDTHAYAWQGETKNIKIEPQQTLTFAIPLVAHSTLEAASDLEKFQTGALPFLLNGEINALSTYGMMISVICEKGIAGTSP